MHEFLRNIMSPSVHRECQRWIFPFTFMHLVPKKEQLFSANTGLMDQMERKDDLRLKWISRDRKC